MANGCLLTKELGLTVNSFNCRGLNDHKKCYIGSLLHDCDYYIFKGIGSHLLNLTT